MRVGDSSSSSSGAAAAAAAAAAERYRLSFGGRLGARRRVFARLAPHHGTELAVAGGGRSTIDYAPGNNGGASDGASSDGGAGDDDNDDGLLGGTADQYFEAQMRMLPQTPPRDRAGFSDSDSSSDSGSESDSGSGSGSDRGAAPAGSVGGEWHAEQALAQFAQAQRLQFLESQWPGSTSGRSTSAGAALAMAALHRPQIAPRVPPARHGPGASHGVAMATAAPPPLFPSNDVDSYWYNQPDAGDAAPGARPAGLRRPGHLPSIPRNPAAEQSRAAMLEVLRTRHLFALGAEKPDTPDDDDSCDSDSDSAAGGGGGPRAARARRLPGRRARRLGAQADARLERWLERYTVEVRDLGCALLRPGIRLSGIQKITPQGGGCVRPVGAGAEARVHPPPPPPATAPGIEQWDVQVEIQSVDMARGYVAGLMKAINVPRLPEAVVTCWEGEIVDFVNHMPLTAKWQAARSDDLRHWSLFAPVHAHQEGFLHDWPKSMRGRRMPQLLEDYILMRWKETSFVNVKASETGLTIEGFYYVCMNRRTGSLEGVYFDPSTQPYQRLALSVESGRRGGMSFASAECC
ncbi:hypothetical protein H4R18_003094 [Coemansia javaensis]|uniref:Vacuolar import and degradation protein-domain-containing protein n=1 Tax=Coemansia javaensis TaxID=2761396 RepID=A0A9W8H8Y3_9FUNG|nr:hypothetical protein H4R18_003094 [Coemansia javaensis]